MPRRRIALVAVAALVASGAFAAVRLQQPATALPDWLDYLNAYRSTANVQQVVENTTYSANDVLHSRYMVKNNQLSHSEDPSNPWYTPGGSSAGLNSNVTMAFGTIPTDRKDIDGWMAAPFHAAHMIDAGLTTVGYGRYDEGTTHGGSLDVLSAPRSLPSTTFPLPWPRNGATVPIGTFDGNESPDPLAFCPGFTAPTGLPLLIQTNNGSVAPNVTAAGIADSATPGTPIPVCTIHQNTPGLGSPGDLILGVRNTVILIPRTPLQVGHTYNASLTANGVTTTWSFTIGAPGSLPSVTPPASSGYNPLTPARILDTRSTAVLGPAATLDLDVTGPGGVPATGVEAVVLNVTAVSPTAQSFLTVFPSDAAQPTVSNLNYAPGQVIPNLVIAKVGANGNVKIYNHAGSVHVLADVQGWFPAGDYRPLAPARILDTRNTAVLGPAATLDLDVTGPGGVPATGVEAVVLNVTAVSPTAQSFLTVFPSDAAQPTGSNLNYAPGQVIPNLVIAKVGANGNVKIYNHAGSVHVLVDVQGWFPAGDYRPLAPARILDTRNTAVLGPAATLDLDVTGPGGVPATGVEAVVLNVTAVSPTAQSFLTVFPSDAAQPTGSNLNYAPGQVIPNLVIAKVGANGNVKIYNHAGSVHVLADVQGWFPV